MQNAELNNNLLHLNATEIEKAQIKQKWLICTLIIEKDVIVQYPLNYFSNQ
jgi:hypothetical protein